MPPPGITEPGRDEELEVPFPTRGPRPETAWAWADTLPHRDQAREERREARPPAGAPPERPPDEEMIALFLTESPWQGWSDRWQWWIGYVLIPVGVIGFLTVTEGWPSLPAYLVTAVIWLVGFAATVWWLARREQRHLVRFLGGPHEWRLVPVQYREHTVRTRDWERTFGVVFLGDRCQYLMGVGGSRESLFRFRSVSRVWMVGSPETGGVIAVDHDPSVNSVRPIRSAFRRRRWYRRFAATLPGVGTPPAW